MSLDDFILEKNPKPHCKGIIFRADCQNYIGKKGEIVFKTVLKQLKKKSCPGCEQCGWLESDIREFISFDTPFLGIENIEPNKFYTFQVTNISKDWESGIVDDWDLEIVEIEGDPDGL